MSLKAIREYWTIVVYSKSQSSGPFSISVSVFELICVISSKIICVNDMCHFFVLITNIVT